VDDRHARTPPGGSVGHEMVRRQLGHRHHLHPAEAREAHLHPRV
jgi:hypothetical protein